MPIFGPLLTTRSDLDLQQNLDISCPSIPLTPSPSPPSRLLHSPPKVAGSLHVRVRRDADEQAVLTKIQQNLGQLVAPGSLTVQIVKDDWVLPGTPGSL